MALSSSDVVAGNDAKASDYNNLRADVLGTHHRESGGSLIDSADIATSKRLLNLIAQTITGIKTFLSIPILPATTPTTDNQATRKKYVDDQVTAATGNPGWVFETSLSWSAETTDKTASGLTVADMYMLIFNIEQASTAVSTVAVTLQMNGITTSDYTDRSVVGNSFFQNSGRTDIRIFRNAGTAATTCFGQMFIKGRHFGGFKVIKSILTLDIFGGNQAHVLFDAFLSSDSNDLTSIKILLNGHELSGTIKFFRLDL